jgi:hypothetical protein
LRETSKIKTTGVEPVVLILDQTTMDNPSNARASEEGINILFLFVIL